METAIVALADCSPRGRTAGEQRVCPGSGYAEAIHARGFDRPTTEAFGRDP